MGDIMKVYFIFRLKDEFINLYRDTPSVLFQILKNIYYLDKEEVEYGYHLFKQLTLSIPKEKIDRDIFIRYHQDIPYSKRENTHYINDFYRNEISRMTLGNNFIKLELEQDFSSFFTILQKELNNLFVCSFRVTDFFFLDDYLLENSLV